MAGYGNDCARVTCACQVRNEAFVKLKETFNLAEGNIGGAREPHIAGRRVELRVFEVHVCVQEGGARCECRVSELVRDAQ